VRPREAVHTVRQSPLRDLLSSYPSRMTIDTSKVQMWWRYRPNPRYEYLVDQFWDQEIKVYVRYLDRNLDIINAHNFIRSGLIGFYRAMLRRARYCCGKSSVYPSLCP